MFQRSKEPELLALWIDASADNHSAIFHWRLNGLEGRVVETPTRAVHIAEAPTLKLSFCIDYVLDAIGLPEFGESRKQIGLTPQFGIRDVVVSIDSHEVINDNFLDAPPQFKVCFRG